MVPGRRRAGAGRALVAACCDWARGHGHGVLGSDSVVGNLLGEAAHRAAGFEEVERVVLWRRHVA